MNKKLLTVLGCSGSVALSLVATNPASAKEYVFTAPEADNQVANIPESKTDYPFVGCSCSEYDPATAAQIDQEGEKAVELFGCDCAGHRNRLRSLNAAKQNQKFIKR